MLDVVSNILDFITENVAVLISFLAMVVTAFNVNEVRKQRVKMYEPTIILEDNTWNSEENSLQIAPSLKLRNVGYGTALDIKCTWHLSKPLINTKFINGVENELILFTIPSLKSGTESDGIVNKEQDLNKKFQYLLPINIDGSYLEVQTPILPFLESHGLIRELVERNRLEEELESIYPLRFNLEIEYKDINLKKYLRNYEVDVEFGYLDLEKYKTENKLILLTQVKANIR